MKDAGIVLHESFDGKVYGNNVYDSVYGIRLVVGAGNNHVYENTFKDISTGEIHKCSKREVAGASIWFHTTITDSDTATGMPSRLGLR